MPKSHQMHGSAAKPIACKAGSLEEYGAWAEKYIRDELGAGVVGELEVAVNTGKKALFAIANGRGKQLRNVAIPANAVLFYGHNIQAVHRYTRPAKPRAVKEVVHHSYWFDVSRALTNEEKARIEKAEGIGREEVK